MRINFDKFPLSYRIAIRSLSSQDADPLARVVNLTARRMFREGTCKVMPYQPLPDSITEKTILDALCQVVEENILNLSHRWVFDLTDDSKYELIVAVFVAVQMIDAVEELPF